MYYVYFKGDLVFKYEDYRVCVEYIFNEVLYKDTNALDYCIKPNLITFEEIWG